MSRDPIAERPSRGRVSWVAACALLLGALLVWAAGAAGATTAYVTNLVSDDVTPIDVATSTPGDPISVGTGPRGIAITPDGATAYVTNANSNDVTPIDLATNTPGGPISVGTLPEGIAITPDGATAYVANIGSNNVTPIDVATNTPGTPIPVGTGPIGIAITPDGATAYVANQLSNNVTPIDVATDTAGTQIAVPTQPVGIAITPDGATAYVANQLSNDVTPIELATNTPRDPIPAGTQPKGIAITPDGATAYVANQLSHDVTGIHLATEFTGTIPVGTGPRGIAITPDGATAYVANQGSNDVTPIDVASNTAGDPIPAGALPFGIAITPAIAGTPDRDTVAFGDQDVASGPSAPETVTLQSTGTGNLTPSAASLAGAEPGGFSISADGCAGAVLQPGQTCSVSVAFDPGSEGPKAATLSIPSNDPDGPATVALTGTGTTPPPPPPPPAPGPPPAPTSGEPVCNSVPERRTSRRGRVTYTRSALKIQQNIDSAVLRRLNAINAWIDAGIEQRDLCASAFGPSAFQAGMSFAGGGAHDASAPDPRSIQIQRQRSRGQITRSRRQLVINERISRALRARAVATLQRISALTGGNLAPQTTLAGRAVWPGLQTQGPQPESIDGLATALQIGALPRAIPIRENAATVRAQQRRSQGSIRIANRSLDAIRAGLTEQNFVSGSIGSGHF